MYEITLRAMRFHALVGILPHERELPQPIEIDLCVWVADGETVVDYRALYDLSANAVSNPTSFLEQIADRIVADALAHNARIRRVRVAVRKPHVGLPGPLDYAEVTLERLADD